MPSTGGRAAAGTTSNYARTRAALLTLTLTRIDELDAADGAAGGTELDCPGRVAGTGLAERWRGWLDRMLITNRGAAAGAGAVRAGTRGDPAAELRAAYDEMGRGFRARRPGCCRGRVRAARAGRLDAHRLGGGHRLLRAGRRGRGGRPVAAELRAQVTGLLASLCGDDAGAA